MLPAELDARGEEAPREEPRGVPPDPGDWALIRRARGEDVRDE